MNRVKEYYVVAVQYLSLSIGARFIVATALGLIDDRTLAYADADEMDRLVFVGVVKKKIFDEFRKLVWQHMEYQKYDNRI